MLTQTEAAARFPQREAFRLAAFTATPPASTDRRHMDPRGKGEYSLTLPVYILQDDKFALRCLVHAPDRQSLPIARNAGRFISVLWTALDRRIGARCARLRDGVVDVWLTRSGEGGGETFDRQVYVYDLFADRTDLEWARELAHEMGHVLLPSPSNYMAPENWGNGVLGERLFLRWLKVDMLSSFLEPGEAPFITKDNLEYYCQRQVTPLIEGMRANGPDASLLGKNTKQAMDAYTGLMMYASEVYGPNTILDLLERLPARKDGGLIGADFLSALEIWLASQSKLNVRVRGDDTIRLYLPAGNLRFRNPAVTAISIGGSTLKQSTSGVWSWRNENAGWRVVKVTHGMEFAEISIETVS